MDKNIIRLGYEAALESAPLSFPRESEAMIAILTKYGYEDLSQENQFSMLTLQEYDRNEMHLGNYFVLGEGYPGCLWQRTIDFDLVDHMEVLLLRTPLFAINKHNIPPQLTWIESPEWMQDTLYANRARWNGEVCDYDIDIAPKAEDTKLAILKQLAFTMHANSLFYHCCGPAGANDCGQYLLEKAPHLVQMKAYSPISDFWKKHDMPLYRALQSEAMSNQVAYMVQLGATLGEHMDNVETLAKLLANNLNINMQLVIQVLSKGREADVKLYRDKYGSSLLHILHSQFETKVTFNFKHSRHYQQIVDGTKLLLDCGVDVTDPNNSSHTAFDALMEEFRSIILRIRTERKFCEQRIKCIQSVSSCMQLLLPFLNKEASKAFILPNMSPKPLELCLSIIQIFQCLLKADLFARNLERDLGYLLFSNIMNVRLSSPCTMCVPITTLLYDAMYKGLDITKTFSLGESKYLFHFTSSIVEILVQQLSGFHFAWGMCQPGGCWGPTSSTKLQPPQCDVHVLSSACCYWTVLEMLVHSRGEGALARTLTRNVFYPSEQPLTMQLLCRLGKCVLSGYLNCLENIRMIAAFIWMYEQGSISVMDRYLQDLHEELQEEKVKDDILELKDFLHSVRPLKLLSRACILQHVQWKDIKCLPLPPLLQKYVQFGNASVQLVIHNLK